MNQSLAVFHGTPVTLIDHASRKWLTSKEVGLCLGYAEANAGTGISNLYKRHEDEFTETDTCTIKLMGQGQIRETRVYSDTGCIKLGFFANTARAKKFRTWASQALATRQAEPAPAPLDPNLSRLAGDMADLARGMKTILTQMNVTGRYIGLLEMNQQGRQRVTPAIRRQVLALKGEGMNNADIGRLLRISRTTVSLIVNDKYPETGVEDAQPSIAERMDALIELEQARLLGENEGGAA